MGRVPRFRLRPGARRDPAAVSPTALYTGQVWVEAGWSEPGLAHPLGRLALAASGPFNAVSRLATGGHDLTRLCRRRHAVLDLLVEEAVLRGRAQVVVLLAAGLSPRGQALARRHGARGLRVVEVDLPDMAARKRRLLERAGLASPALQVVGADAFAEGAGGGWAVAEQLAAARPDGDAPWLTPDKGVLALAEGLLAYVSPEASHALLRHVAGLPERGLAREAGFLSDLHLGEDLSGVPLIAAFRRGLEWSTAGDVHYAFDTAEHAARSALEAGFTAASCRSPEAFRGRVPLPPPPRGETVRLLEAWTAPGPTASPT